MSTAVAHGLLPLAPILVIVFFFALYNRVIWPRTTGEPWTYIVRRNDWLSAPIIVVGLASIGIASWQAPWWLSWLPVFLGFVIAFWAHIDWGGIRAGEIHRPTAWWCAEDLRAHSPSAADWLEQRLGQAGHPYARSDRTGQRRGL